MRTATGVRRGLHWARAGPVQAAKPAMIDGPMGGYGGAVVLVLQLVMTATSFSAESKEGGTTPYSKFAPKGVSLEPWPPLGISSAAAALVAVASYMLDQGRPFAC